MKIMFDARMGGLTNLGQRRKVLRMKNMAGIGICLLLMTNLSSAGLLHTYNELTLKNLDQMSKLVREKIKEAKKSRSGRVVPLKEALQAVYIRPNDDGMIEKVVPALKAELDGMNAYDSTLKTLVQEAVDALTNPKNFKPSAQVSYAIFLENVIAQLRPRLNEGGMEKTLIEKISKSEIELSSEAKKERKLRLMRESRSPSLIAKEVLEKSQAPSAVGANPTSGPGVAPAKEGETNKGLEINPE